MRLTSKGQVTIPKPVRERLNLRAGSEVSFEEADGRFYLVRKDNEAFWRDRFEKVRGSAEAGLSTADIMRLTRGDDWDDEDEPDVAG